MNADEAGMVVPGFSGSFTAKVVKVSTLFSKTTVANKGSLAVSLRTQKQENKTKILKQTNKPNPPVCFGNPFGSLHRGLWFISRQGANDSALFTFIAILRRVSQARGSRQAEPQRRSAKCGACRAPTLQSEQMVLPMPTTTCVTSPPLSESPRYL